MMATQVRPKTEIPDSLEKIVKVPPTQTDSSGGNLPPPNKPTAQGPDAFGDNVSYHAVLKQLGEQGRYMTPVELLKGLMTPDRQYVVDYATPKPNYFNH